MSRKTGNGEIVRENDGVLQSSKKLGKELEHQGNEEKRQLLLVEDEPIQVHVISTGCQSTSRQKEATSHCDVIWYNSQTEGNIRRALITLCFALFNLCWSVGLSYWDFQLNNFDIAVTSLLIIVISGSLTTIAFFSATSSPSCGAKRDLWRCSKVAWLLAAVPCLVPVILGVLYFISSVLDTGSQLSCSNCAHSRNECRRCANSNATTSAAVHRLGAGSTSFFLIESLTLCFPMCVLQLCALLEDPNSIPSFKGLYTLLGLFLLSLSITFSRFQFDCLNKRDRFGEGMEKYLRFCYLWSAKLIWLVTFAILIVTARLLYPGHKIEAIAAATAGLTALHELPLWICLLPKCGKLAAKVSSLFFLIPQFTALISLICWVNTDPEVYHRNAGSIVLGICFWAEAVLLCGWLVDGSTDRDIDLVPLYPHFFGDLISSCFVGKGSITANRFSISFMPTNHLTPT